jgi:hypothetical protein
LAGRRAAICCAALLAGAFLHLAHLAAQDVPTSLSVAQIVIAQFDGGPSVAGGFRFGSGESVFLTFDVAGFRHTGGEFPKLKLRWRCQPLDGFGVAMAPEKSGEVDVSLAPEDKNWRPRIRAEFALPQGLAQGTGRVRIFVEDEVAKSTAEADAPLSIRGPDLQGVDGITARRFRFLRREDSVEPLQVAAYAPGDTVWAKFEMAGFAHREGNAFDLSYGLEVLRENGQSLYRQEEAATESGKSFYPRRHVTGILSLQLTRDLAKGEYTIALTVRDLVAGKEAQSSHSFRVE